MPDGEEVSQGLTYAQLAEDERAKADRARDLAEEVERLQSAAIAGLEAELAQLRVSEQAARDEAAAAREEAAAAHGEAAVARTRLAAMMAHGWWARLRNRRPR
jgi:hypothetical protein